MRHRHRTLLALLAWAVSTVPGHGLPASSDGLAGCERQFRAQPEDPESARCFWVQAQGSADQREAARRVRGLLVRYPGNPGLEICAVVFGLVPPDRAEALLRSAAGEYFHRQPEGEVLARDRLVNVLFGQRRLDEAGREAEREAEAARATVTESRARNLAAALISRSRLLVQTGDFEQAGRLLDQVPAGPLRNGRWLVVASQAHLFSGQMDRAWDDGVRMSQPAFSLSVQASGLWCQAQVLILRSIELPGEANRSRIEQVARAARSKAGLGGNRGVAALASWVLVVLAKDAGAARAEFHRCLAAAPDDSSSKVCRRGFARWQVSAARETRGEPDGRAGSLDLDDNDTIERAQSYGDLMRMTWRAPSTSDFVRVGQHALDEIERLRAQQAGSHNQMIVFSTWSDDYYWYSGRLLEAALAGKCPSCLDRAFGAVERLRARALHDGLVAAGAGIAAVQADPSRLAALRQAMGRTARRLGDSTLPRSERDNARSDLEAFKAEEARLQRPAAGADAGTGTATATGAESPAFVTVAAVRQLLAPDEALLSFQIAPWEDWTGDFGGGSWLVVVTKGASRAYRLEEMGRGDLRQEVADLLVQRQRPRSWWAKELYRQLLGPALAGLPPGIGRLIVVPDDHLHRLPFAALLPRPEGAPLAWRYQISLVPSATLWARWRAASRPPPAARPALVLANPPPPTEAERAAFQQAGIMLPLEPLPAAGREADALVRLLGWGCDRRIGREVSEAAIVDSPRPLARYALVHFAAHSIVDDRDPRRSGIWLSPSPGRRGLLQAADIVKLGFDDRLVVLATCSSNGGPFLRGEGVMSLAHAFFQARARTVVASLWPQVDTEAEALVTGFYRHLSQGASVAAALRLAQLELLRKSPGLPVAAWAGMTVLGDGDLVPFPGGRHPWALWRLVVAAAGAATVLALLAGLVRRARGSRGPHRASRG
jgi:CHAT domain-containing protein